MAQVLPPVGTWAPSYSSCWGDSDEEEDIPSFWKADKKIKFECRFEDPLKRDLNISGKFIIKKSGMPSNAIIHNHFGFYSRFINSENLRIENFGIKPKACGTGFCAHMFMHLIFKEINNYQAMFLDFGDPCKMNPPPKNMATPNYLVRVYKGAGDRVYGRARCTISKF
jgi:hypothetical protein